jgi:hypothetical protein
MEYLVFREKKLCLIKINKCIIIDTYPTYYVNIMYIYLYTMKKKK